MIEISDTITLPRAEHIGTRGTIGRTPDYRRWVFACSICERWTLRKNRWNLAGAYLCPGCAGAHNDETDKAGEDYRRAVETLRNEKISDMQGHADVSSPDDWNSPGAVWLLSLHNSISEAWEYGRFGPDSSEERNDVISELADSDVPVYTHNRWQIFTDLCAYEADVETFESLVDEPSKMTDLAGVILYEIARLAFNSWLDEKIESETCEECGEFPCECSEYGDCQECGNDAMDCFDANGIGRCAP